LAGETPKETFMSSEPAKDAQAFFRAAADEVGGKPPLVIWNLAQGLLALAQAVENLQAGPNTQKPK
jgi:hypothetical protein